jgi:hypothetical protein
MKGGKMGFYGSSFIYAGIPSELYDIRIAELNSNSSEQKSMGSSDMEIINKKIARRPVPFFYAATPSPVLSFSVSAYTNSTEIDAEFFALLQSKFFSNRRYDVFQVIQPDMQSSYWNAILKNPQITRVGNLLRGITFDVTCDAPYGFEFPKTITYNYVAETVDDHKIFNNTSHDTWDYVYPNLVITINNIGGDLTITNSDDNDRVFQFTGLSPNEVITMNCGLQTLSSSTGLLRLGNFNKNFLRFVPKLNHLHIQGSVASISMTTQFIAKKIG